MFLFTQPQAGNHLQTNNLLNNERSLPSALPFGTITLKRSPALFRRNPLPVSANIAIFLSNSEYHRTFSFSDSQDRREALCLFKQSIELDTVVDVV